MEGSGRNASKEVLKSLKTKLQLILLAALVIFFAWQINAQAKWLTGLDAQKNDAERRLSLEREISISLKQDEAYLRSDEFIKKVAYERLRLVGDKDVIYIKRK